jgi:hypothetical protein
MVIFLPQMVIMGWHAILQKNVPFCGSHATLCQNSEKCSTKQKGRQGLSLTACFI